MAKDPTERFKQFVGKESGGGQPRGEGFITERQRLNLQPAYLDYLVQRNRKKKHYPKRVTDEQWAEVKVKLKAKQRPPKVAGNNNKGEPVEDTKKKKNAPAKKKNAPAKKKTTTKAKAKKNSAAPSAAPPSDPRRSGRFKNKK